MFFYGLYRMGMFLCAVLPRQVCYWVACRLADLFSARSPEDWRAVRTNLQVVLGTERVPDRQVREVFRNFAMYLVDFFRFSRFTPATVKQWVRIEGLERMQQALREGKGAIGVTAHLGNHELAGAVVSLMGLPVAAAVLTHQNARVDRLFTGQRKQVGVTDIPIQKIGRKAFLEECLKVLRRNEVLGLVADRDFFGRGAEVELFGKKMKAPTGGASFNLRTGAPVFPTFLFRESNGFYRLVVEAPLRCPKGMSRDRTIQAMTQNGMDVMARYIRRYPTQWYMFHQEFWNPGRAFVL
jgi:Kdo2-lipid IVA lauroyltransferase/acyltransferase